MKPLKLILATLITMVSMTGFAQENAALENIYARKSVRNYTEEPVSLEQVETILKAAMAAVALAGDVRQVRHQNRVLVPGSSNPKHIQENIEVFDFELTPEEMAKMEALDQEKRYFNMTYDQIKAWMGDYKIWD